MYLNLRNVVLFTLLCTVAVLTWLAGRPPSPETTPASRSEDTPLGYYIRNATLLGTDESGRVSYRVFAARLEQASRDAPLTLREVFVQYTPESGVHWQMRAARGSVPSNRAYLDLADDVRLTNAEQDGAEPITIETNALRLDTERHIARSDHGVAMTWGRADLRATVLEADLKRDYLELETDVLARFPP